MKEDSLSYRHPNNKPYQTPRPMEHPSKRKFNVSAYYGEGNNVYISTEGGGATREALFSAFKQAAALFGWELTGDLVEK